MEKAQLLARQGPKGTRRWAQETSQVISEESKRTGKMPEYYRLNNKTGEPITNLCNRLNCIPNWADISTCRKGSTEEKQATR